MFSRGRLGVRFVHLSVYTCWSYRMVALMLCYNSMAPSTCKDDISAPPVKQTQPPQSGPGVNTTHTCFHTFFALLVHYIHSLLWRHTVLLMVGVYSSNHRVLYTIGISMTRRFQKSVGPFVTLTKKKPTLSSLLTVEK